MWLRSYSTVFGLRNSRSATCRLVANQVGHRRRRGSRGGRPPPFDALDYRSRNVIERRFCHLKQWRGSATRYDKLATVYRAATVLNAVIAWTKHLSDTL
jgi:transposase